MEIAYDAQGLVPVIVQDWHSGEVLTLAYANAEAVRRTRESGELHLYSRSRQEQWHKGATSGNTQAVRALRLDCGGGGEGGRRAAPPGPPGRAAWQATAPCGWPPGPPPPLPATPASARAFTT